MAILERILKQVGDFFLSSFIDRTKAFGLTFLIASNDTEWTSRFKCKAFFFEWADERMKIPRHLPDPALIRNRWEAVHPGFVSATMLGELQRQTIVDGELSYCLVSGRFTRPESNRELDLLGQYGPFVFYSRPNWSCHYCQLVLMPNDAISESFPQFETLPNGSLRPPRRRVSKWDFSYLTDISRSFRWPILLSVGGGGASVPDEIHYQIYPNEWQGITTFPIIDTLIKRSKPIRFDHSTSFEISYVRWPIPSLVFCSMSNSNESLFNILSQLCNGYSDGRDFNLYLRASSESGLCIVFVPRKKTGKRREYPVSELDKVTFGDWQWGAPECFGCCHLRENIKETIGVIRDNPKLLTDSLYKIAGDIELAIELVRRAVG